MHDTETDPLHPSENPAFVAAHRLAFHTIDAPTALAVGHRVWIIDYYYPGVVRAVGASGYAVVSIPQWDGRTERPLVRDGVLATDDLVFAPEHYRALRVDPASEAFWPSPSGWTSIEA